MKAYTIITSLVLLAWPVSAFAAGGGETKTMTAEPVRLTGQFYTIWGDPVGDSVLSQHHSSRLTDNRDRTWELMIEEDDLRAAGGMLALNNAEVLIEGQTVPGRRATVDVATIKLADDATGESRARDISGSQPYVWLFFKFAEIHTTPSESFEWFQEQALGQYGMDPFWHEVSYNTVDLAGTDIFEWWFVLPGTSADYGIIGDPDNGDVDTGLLLQHAIAAADPAVNFAQYVGMILIFNGPMDCCAWGGRPHMTLDGVERDWGVVWAGVGGYQGHDVMTHEMGHSFGLPHSSGCGVEYESIWDLMGLSCGTCTIMDPRTNTPHGVHANAFHKRQVGWIHPAHQYTLPWSTATAARIKLHELAHVPPEGELLMAEVDLSSWLPLYYTIERRSRIGYDANLPADAVAIHEVNELRSIPSDLVDVDGGECNDEGSTWRQGESFYDGSYNVLISIDWADEDSSVVTLTNEPRSTVYVNWSSVSCENGTSGCPWNTVSEGHAGAMPTGQVYIAPGIYPERLIMGKPATLAPWGSGTVRIGQ